VLFLNDDEMAVLSAKGPHHRPSRQRGFRESPVSSEPGHAEKGGYRHFMLKEIHEQRGRS